MEQAHIMFDYVVNLGQQCVGWVTQDHIVSGLIAISIFMGMNVMFMLMFAFSRYLNDSR